ncbi:MAG: Oligopeptide transport ATP-binding protein OppD [Sedimentibacter sp.]|jgi:peptide/nickel transport system ATP-binding protein|nr:Oligopeptide transport ATP-binding protein OppD [Sedimentibacter sp.]
MGNLLEVKNLGIDLVTKNSTKTLVDDVSFEIGRKQSYGIVGESGCGKSITALSIMQLLSYPLKTSGGQILFESETGKIDLLSLTKEMRKLRGKEISMIFQEPMTALDPIFTIEQQIVETLNFHTNLKKVEKHKIALEMLKKVGIPRAEQILKEYPHQLSGGMLQRIMIAIALICKPKLLIADEPTTALDVTIQAQILDLMNELKESYDTSIIMITHDLGVIAETCEKVAVFYAGQVVEETDVVSLFHKTAHPYTTGLLKAVTSLGDKSNELYTIPGLVPAGGYIPNGCRFEERCRMAKDICRQKAPQLIEIEKGHKCRCWLYGESGDRK